MVTRTWLSVLSISILQITLTSKVIAETYSIHTSKVTLRMGHMPLGRFDTDGVDALSGKFKISSTGEISVLEPIKFEAIKLTSQVPLRDEHMKNKNLEISKFPFIELTSIKAFKDKTNFEGNLKVKNMVSVVSGSFSSKEETMNQEFPQATLFKIQASFNSKLSNYKIEPPQYMGVGVKDEFEVVLEMFLEEETDVPTSSVTPSKPAAVEAPANKKPLNLRKKGKS